MLYAARMPGTEYTTRLGLSLHDMSDELTSQVRDWERIDEAFSGVVWVPDGTTPDSGFLYEGCLVAEQTSGKVWRATKTQTGAFVKKWIKFPWLAYNVVSVTNLASSLSWSTIGFDGLDLTKCINVSQADIQANNNALIMPLDGLYRINVKTRFNTNGGTTGLRGVVLIYEGGADVNIDTFSTQNSKREINGISTPITNVTRKFSKGNILRMGIFQTSTISPMDVMIRAAVTLVRPQ